MRLLAAAAAATALLVATPGWADPWDFVLINSTGKAIKKLEIAPGGTTAWKANDVDAELKKDMTVKPGQRTTMHFDKADAVCKYDLKATFDDDSTAIWGGINVCDNAYVTVKYTGGTPSFAAS